MTAGSGIIHQEMPKGDAKGLKWGFQFWANLPASHKMMGPRYRGILSQEIPQCQRVVVYCVKSGSVSQSITTAFVNKDIRTCYVEGGLKAWKESS
jgi:redox-sensitive bicupin YhaK (pirin superfamily)